MDCAFGSFVPGSDSDPDPGRAFKDYRQQAYRNTREAGALLWPGAFRLSEQQLAKVDGDVYEMMEAAALWNAAATWNKFMDTGLWDSSVFRKPDGAVPTPTRKVAIVKMARGADTTKLLSPAARAEYFAFETALQKRGLELKLSTPDILGLRIPDPMPAGFEIFMSPLPDLTLASQEQLETAWRGIQGSLEGRHFLFAIAVKTSTRSDRLYQALFEANVLKYILGYVLRGPAIRFHAHLETFANADVVGRYKAASMTSLLAGGVPSKAVDQLYLALNPRDTAQMILDELPTYPL
ncbi:Cfr10I/Bse634I family restriction endonuclease [Novosphingobium piscinae]|uniref:Cfr10I/Bse634I family restriction endonuclease n=2 Tax=Novosphingobium piscinae TaxID=1507448 RepID=A0A7X1FWE7_9SPHN|nr:Cfr10I/Bse634I family restriction endonuclease [Novosphingobium piscinae]